MQNDDFLSGCARTMELSIKGQQLLTQDMACGLRRLWRGVLTKPQLVAVQIFWTFVVGLWPVLYVLVYL